MLSVLRKSIKITWCGCLVFGGVPAIGATPNNHGPSGDINRPNASVEADGTYGIGYGYDSLDRELGATAVRTNGKHATSPGTLASPDNDKDIFVSIPLDTMLASDPQATAGFAKAASTRDMDQMVAATGDLVQIMDTPQRDISTSAGLGNVAERVDEKNHPAVNPPEKNFRNPLPAMRMRLDDSFSALPDAPDFVKGAGLAAGAVIIASLGDKKTDQYFKDHSGSRLVRGWDKIGNAAPFIAIGAAGMAMAMGDDRMQNTGLISLQSVAAAVGASTVLKYAVGRARPEEGLGTWQRSTSSRSDSSFPSGHTAVTFAAVTPFAKEYDAPWLYGVAALASMGRVAGREHWVSDVVAGGVLGYAVGSWLWQAQRDGSKYAFSINPVPGEVAVTWRTSY